MSVPNAILYSDTNVNAAKSNGDTALHLASLHGFRTIVEALLLRSDLDPGALNKRNLSALDYAEQRGHTEIAVLLSNRIGQTEAHAAVK